MLSCAEQEKSFTNTASVGNFKLILSTGIDDLDQVLKNVLNTFLNVFSFFHSSIFLFGFFGFLDRLFALHRGQMGALR